MRESLSWSTTEMDTSRGGPVVSVWVGQNDSPLLPPSLPSLPPHPPTWTECPHGDVWAAVRSYTSRRAGSHSKDVQCVGHKGRDIDGQFTGHERVLGALGRDDSQGVVGDGPVLLVCWRRRPGEGDGGVLPLCAREALWRATGGWGEG